MAISGIAYCVFPRPSQRWLEGRRGSFYYVSSSYCGSADCQKGRSYRDHDCSETQPVVVEGLDAAAVDPITCACGMILKQGYHRAR